MTSHGRNSWQIEMFRHVTITEFFNKFNSILIEILNLKRIFSMFLNQKQRKLTNLKRVIPMFFYQKMTKVDKFVNGTLCFLSKMAKINKFKGVVLCFYQNITKMMQTVPFSNLLTSLFFSLSSSKLEPGAAQVFRSRSKKFRPFAKKFFSCTVSKWVFRNLLGSYRDDFQKKRPMSPLAQKKQ